MSMRIPVSLLTMIVLALVSIAPARALQNPGGSGDTTRADSTKKKDAAWDVSAHHGPFTDIEFETDEGTWISVDVSPDGGTVVFDLLGDIYSVPIGGGNAAPLSGGPAYETQPRYSPDGRKISFTSDGTAWKTSGS